MNIINVNCDNCGTQQMRITDIGESPQQGTWPCIICNDENCAACYISHIEKNHPEQYGLTAERIEAEKTDHRRKDRNRRKAKKRSRR